LDEAIKQKKVDPAIIVFINGAFDSMYSDYHDGSVMVESTIMDELIPLIEKQYRTIDTREGRKLFGFSMGGFGSLKLGFKYPEKFSSIVSYAGAFHNTKTYSKYRAELYERIFNSDPELFNQNSPMALAQSYKDNSSEEYPLDIQVVVGTNDITLKLGLDGHITIALNEANIEYEYKLLEGPEHFLEHYFDIEEYNAFHFLLDNK
jgi:enterochelin esterase-like enzyme